MLNSGIKEQTNGFCADHLVLAALKQELNSVYSKCTYILKSDLSSISKPRAEDNRKE